ncbi:DUF4115 domain-containing protein, partial [Desulfosarcina sp.]|uniref:DUF4115 domain-containing protein n=1 Tax=Desulfosarcina sp. TaxID=2027861 RepID=UPI003970CE46
MTGLVVGTVLTYQRVYHQEAAHEARAPVPAAIEEAPPAGETVAPPDAVVQKTPAEAAAPEAPAAGRGVPETAADPRPAAYLLEIVCEEDTWLKAIADDAPASQHYLKPGDILHLEADRMFNLLIGNAGGVSLQLNGNPVPVPGRSGEVVNLELP